jgi:ubiquinone/menaquinone biosynthesis C-methylase UbiE
MRLRLDILKERMYKVSHEKNSIQRHLAKHLIRRFIEVNQTVCRKIEPYLPQAKMNIFGLHERLAAHYMNSRVGQVVVDVGGGRSCQFARYRDPAAKAKIIAVDVSEEELQYNADVDETRIADVTRGLPFDTEEIDLLVSRSVLEHLSSLDSFVAASKRVLRQGGYSIHLFPSKFAPFALINQSLPNVLSRRVLYIFLPDHRGIGGFPAHYDNCYYSSIKRLFEKHSFEVVSVHLTYYQSGYFSFFLPLYLISALYEMLLQALGMKNLAAHVVIVVRKK